MPDDDAGLASLAAAMRARIDHLELTSVEITNRGGPHRGALREILNATRVPRKATLAAIDAILGWPAGLAAGILHGTEPIPDPDAWLELPKENRLGVIRARLVQLLKDQRRMAQTCTAQADQTAELIRLLDDERR